MGQETSLETPSCIKTVVVLLAAALSLPAQAANVTVKFIHTDAQGTPLVATDKYGTVIERYEYEPYGLQVSGPVADGPGYTGHVEDTATGLVYMQQRYYDPGIGGFLSVDPVTAYSNPVGQFNRYRYANGNPYLYTDPTGMEGCADMGTQGVSGACVDSSNFEAGGNADTVVSDAKTDLVALDNMASLKSSNSENLGSFSKDEKGNVSFQKAESVTTEVDGIYTTTASIPGDASAVGHSHPENGSSPAPGPADDQAVDKGKPNYIYQNDRIVVIEKSGGQFRARVIKGRLTNKERQATQRQLNEYQGR